MSNGLESCTSVVNCHININKVMLHTMEFITTENKFAANNRLQGIKINSLCLKCFFLNGSKKTCLQVDESEEFDFESARSADKVL